MLPVPQKRDGGVARVQTDVQDDSKRDVPGTVRLSRVQSRTSPSRNDARFIANEQMNATAGFSPGRRLSMEASVKPVTPEKNYHQEGYNNPVSR